MESGVPGSSNNLMAMAISISTALLPTPRPPRRAPFAFPELEITAKSASALAPSHAVARRTGDWNMIKLLPVMLLLLCLLASSMSKMWRRG